MPNTHAYERGRRDEYAYKIVHRLNEELKAKGYLTIAGRIHRNYFLEKTCYQPEGKAADSLPKGVPIP